MGKGFYKMKEVLNILKNAKLRKEARSDDVLSKLLKLLEDDSFNMLVDLSFNTIYASGKIPEKWLTSTFITLLRKNNLKERSYYQTIALMSHTFDNTSKNKC